MQKKIFLAIALLSLLSFFEPAHASSERQEYRQALEGVRSGNSNFAIMHLRNIVARDSRSRYAEKSLFATAEYYFHIADYRDSFGYFVRFLSEFPESRMRPFAMFYLLSLARHSDNPDSVKQLENSIRKLKQSVFLFKDKRNTASPHFSAENICWFTLSIRSNFI